MFDRDAHESAAAAIQRLRESQLKLAFSNPNIELWAVLHFRDQTAWIDRHACQSLASELMAGYDHDKGAKFDYSAMAPNLAEASARADELERRRQDAELEIVDCNPWTNVQALVRQIESGPE